MWSVIWGKVKAQVYIVCRVLGIHCSQLSKTVHLKLAVLVMNKNKAHSLPDGEYSSSKTKAVILDCLVVVITNTFANPF